MSHYLILKSPALVQDRMTHVYSVRWLLVVSSDLSYAISIIMSSFAHQFSLGIGLEKPLLSLILHWVSVNFQIIHIIHVLHVISYLNDFSPESHD